jgi:uncharacterized protein with HEPN domain
MSASDADLTLLAGTRDYIAHGYDSVDYDVIWGVLDVEAGKLRESVRAILAKEFPETPPR